MYILQEVVQRARSARLRQFCSYDFLKILWVDRGVHASRVGPKKVGVECAVFTLCGGMHLVEC